MKAIPAEILSNNNNNIINGKIAKTNSHKTKNIENEEIQMYLSKLKELVPFMPKNKKLSKLEVIQYVIEYICDLQYALETHPNLDSAAVESAAIAMLTANSARQAEESEETISRTSSNSRQPLGVLIPNPIVKSSLVSSSDVSSVSSILCLLWILLTFCLSSLLISKSCLKIGVMRICNLGNTLENSILLFHYPCWVLSSDSFKNWYCRIKNSSQDFTENSDSEIFYQYHKIHEFKSK